MLRRKRSTSTVNSHVNALNLTTSLDSVPEELVLGPKVARLLNGLRQVAVQGLGHQRRGDESDETHEEHDSVRQFEVVGAEVDDVGATDADELGDERAEPDARLPDARGEDFHRLRKCTIIS